MKRIFALAAVAAMLAACADETGTDVVDPDPDPDPDVVEVALTRGDLKAATINGDDTLSVQITFDGGVDVAQLYTDIVATDGPFTIYQLNEGDTGRLYTAISAEDLEGTVSAVVVSDGGQFNRFFGGSTVTQNSYTAPDGGVTDYVGGYYGLLNSGDEFNDPGFGDSSVAVRSFVVEGQVFFKADFTDGSVNGAIYDRSAVFGAEVQDLPEIVLVAGGLNADGTFSGDLEMTDQTGVGIYAGAIGGDGGTAVAGLVELSGADFLGTRDQLDFETGEPIPNPEYDEFDPESEEFLQENIGDENTVENGIFVLTPLVD